MRNATSAGNVRGTRARKRAAALLSLGATLGLSASLAACSSQEKNAPEPKPIPTAFLQAELDKRPFESCDASKGWGGGQPLTYGETIGYMLHGKSKFEAKYPDTFRMQKKQLPTFLAIFIAESHLCPKAINRHNDDHTRDIGIAQLNSEVAANLGYTEASLLDPATNLFAAFEFWREGKYNFSPWTAFKNDNYLSNLEKAERALDAYDTLHGGLHVTLE